MSNSLVTDVIMDARDYSAVAYLLALLATKSIQYIRLDTEVGNVRIVIPTNRLDDLRVSITEEQEAARKASAALGFS